MEGADIRIIEKVQSLSDLELAVLICLVADQHCIIETEKEHIPDVQEELKLVAGSVFGLTWAVLECDENTTLDDFGNGILVRADEYEDSNIEHEKKRGQFSSISRSPDPFGTKSPSGFSPLDSERIANVVIARNLNQASSQVQIQALELIRGKRNFTRTAVHTAPKLFLFIALNTSGTPRLAMHLNDQFFISHKHQAEDGLPNMEELQEKERALDDGASMSSVDLMNLTKLTSEVRISSEVRAYLHNIVVFMRLHRAVAGGISALATRHFNTLAHALAPLHGLNYISPSMVALAARKIYPHRIIIAAPENERSMQWGSSLEAVKAVLEGVTVEDVIEEVLESVEVPL
ncbi:hypothetical protein PTNB73_02275 [Pyrenophora teres f. teres]|uniref:magnesium chelatase n=1 Tax=Pyrenophora teres f. teres TaxID=97479 RepID=A0A6S6VX68_9PLEO|nr:hypothetical protein HRS9139_00861 [Pyrenophora teres f. teres]KAE8848434.1 hypothetical protein PTNB85_02277 [Pyrenophora teres f. teres]KAE8853401.1 hypothetical protein HRS9122_00393 [Pyrenophora teres f. teres]KAE8868359.1 hypothetical protein PTNB29_02270 [Pyrenophora teres f. teres]KAE8873124.1 hypothetical protein PTNB73_02275 [Pyrenophora teres f. teres]